MAAKPPLAMKSGRHHGLFALSCSALVAVVGILFFAVDLRYGFPHFDTYQYSASVGPQASGLRPKLLRVEGIEEFKNGAELTLPGLYWIKRLIFTVFPYGLRLDQAFSFLWLVLSSVLALVLLRQAGWRGGVPFLMFALMLTAPTFLVNATGTRPEPLAVLILLSGVWLVRKDEANTSAFLGGFLLGFAGLLHIYATLIGPVLAVAIWLSSGASNLSSTLKRLGWIGIGIISAWSILVIFWLVCPDAWHLFKVNLSVQRGFHNSNLRFIAYLQSFKLGSGWWVAALLIVLPAVSWVRWIRSGRSRSGFAVPLLISICCAVIPASFWILKTEQYFYGDLLWPAMVCALILANFMDRSYRVMVTLILTMALSGGLLRLVARAKLGIVLHDQKPAKEQRQEWLRGRVSGASRLYLFTTEWDIASELGVKDVRFYAFPLPMIPELVSQFDLQTFASTPDGALLLFDRDYADNCPYANRGAFDPSGSQEWELRESHTWHYDLSPNKPAARVWELWLKKVRH